MQVLEEGEGWNEGFSFPLKTSVPPEGLAFIVPLQGTGSVSTLCSLASSQQCFTYRLKINLQPVSCPSQGIFHSETSWSREFFSVCPSVCGFGQQNSCQH